MDKKEKKTNKNTFKIKYFLTKTYNEDNTVPFAWINTEHYILNKEDIFDLLKYVQKKQFINQIFIVNNIEVTRPQRTWGTMPDWFRPTSWYNTFDDNHHTNSFIFAIYNNEWGNEILEVEIKNSLESFPKKCKIVRISKNDIKTIDNKSIL